MDVDATGNRVFQRSANRSYRFLAGTVLLVINVFGGSFLLFRHLDYLPFGAVGCLVAGIILLATSWWLALRFRERVTLLLNGKNGHSKDNSITEALMASAHVLETGILVTNIVALMFLTTLAQVLSSR